MLIQGRLSCDLVSVCHAGFLSHSDPRDRSVILVCDGVGAGAAEIKLTLGDLNTILNLRKLSDSNDAIVQRKSLDSLGDQSRARAWINDLDVERVGRCPRATAILNSVDQSNSVRA